MKHRNEQDTYINFLVLKKLIQELKGFSKQSIQNELDLGVLLQEMHEAGFYLDQAKAFNLYIDAKKHADSFEEQIRHAFPKRSVLVREVSPKETKAGGFSKAQTKCLGDTYSDAVGGPFSLFEYEDFNIDSPSQRVARLLERGWKPTTFTKPSQTHPNGQPKFDADDLEHGDLKTLPKEALLIGKYLLCRSRERLASQWLDLVDSKGYVHGRITGLGAWSHRATHTNPNTANIPNIQFDDAKHPLKGLDGVFGWECRDCWVVDPRDADEDVILDADLTAIQLRAFAHLTEDMDYISLVSDPSVDMHNVHKEYLGGVPRASAKRWLYAFLLGAGNAKLGTLLGGDSKMGREAADLFMLKVPGVKKLKEQIIPVWVRQGFLVGLDGRRVPVPSFHLGLAAYLQSFEKIVIAHAMIRHIRWAKENEIPMQYRFWIHDQVVGTVPKDHADACGKAFVNIVNKVGTDLGSLCPLTAAYNTGMTWAEASH
jgi:DNA polymerase-1